MHLFTGIPIRHDKLTGQCFAGGVQLKNLKASFAPRQPCKQVPILEQYQYVPYNVPCILSKSEKELCDNYIQVCSSVSKRILELSGKNKHQINDVMNGFKEADDALIASYLKSAAENHVLLKSLCGIMDTASSKDLTTHAKNHTKAYLSQRENDSLYQTLVNEVPLRNIVDIALENASSRKFKVAEVAEGIVPLSQKIFEYTNSLGVLDIKYFIAHSNPQILEKEELPPNAEVTNWDFKTGITFKDVDLFVLKYLGYSRKEMKRILQDVYSSVKQDGFIAVLQKTKFVPAEMFLSAVGDTVIPVTAENDMEQIFKELGLNTICKKSDSLTSTLYLLRKPSDRTYKESVIQVIADKYDAWVNQLKDRIVDAQYSSDSERIWLVSDQSNQSGIIGLVNCLRQEPGGENIR